MAKRGRTILLVLLKVAVSAGVLWLLVSRLDLARTWSYLAASDKLLWGAAFACLVLSQVLSTVRWQLLLRPLEFELSWWRVFRIYFTGMFFSLFLPSVVGGDGVKTYYVARGWRKAPAAIYSLLADRGIGLAAMVVFGQLGALLVWPAIPPYLAWGVTALTLGVYAGYFLFPRLSAPLLRLSAKLREMPREKLFVYWAQPRSTFNAWLVSMPVHFLLVVTHLLMARSLGISVPVGALLLVYPLTALAAMVPISLNGLGFREAAYVALLAIFGVNQEAAGSLALMWFSLVVGCGLLGFPTFLDLLWRDRKGAGAAAETEPPPTPGGGA